MKRPAWRCDRRGCGQWTPHGEYSCRACGASQPTSPEFELHEFDADVMTAGATEPSPAQPPRRTGSAPADLAGLLVTPDYDAEVMH